MNQSFINRGHRVSIWNGDCIAWIPLPCSKFNAVKLYCYTDRVEVLCALSKHQLKFVLIIGNRDQFSVLYSDC